MEGWKFFWQSFNFEWFPLNTASIILISQWLAKQTPVQAGWRREHEPWTWESTRCSEEVLQYVTRRHARYTHTNLHKTWALILQTPTLDTQRVGLASLPAGRTCSQNYYTPMSSCPIAHGKVWPNAWGKFVILLLNERPHHLSKGVFQQEETLLTTSHPKSGPVASQGITQVLP